MPDPVVAATTMTPPPDWALRERHLIDAMNRSAPAYQARYTRADGTLVWRERWPGMDGSDDAYESFGNFPLFYALGGDADILQIADRAWEAVTWQWTQYGTVDREFDKYYDWMHHGEGYLSFYYNGLACPYRLKDVQRARRFAAMYTGDDYDMALREYARGRVNLKSLISQRVSLRDAPTVIRRLAEGALPDDIKTVITFEQEERP
jgi:hypothetical protein